MVDRYRIVGLLGRGGMGEVYRAEDLKLGQPVALKFLPANMEKDGSRLERLLNEVRLARQVSHPNVCRVYDVGEVDGSHFMAMEYVDGEDLASLLRRIGRLPHEKALEISRQICAGLAAAHDQGILHRDLKPANVMIDGRGRVKLADFGLANLATVIKGDEARAGTPAYMAPEQLAGREVTVRSDIFSLGLVLYETFTGQPAIRGNSLAEIQSVHQQATLTNPSTLVEQVDDMVEQVILRCLEKEPLTRPQSALAVAAALPGGDPLAAALAAGETPSPKMVADAGTAGGLRPVLALGALMAVILVLVLSVHNAHFEKLDSKVPLDTPPGELAARSLQTLADLGIENPGRHRRFGFTEARRYLAWLSDQEPPADAAILESGSPPGAGFWFRYSPSEMQPSNFNYSHVTMHDPVQSEPEQGKLWLDLQGNLRGLEIIPGRNIETDRSPVSWSVLFAAAGMDLATFEPTEPIRSPLVPCGEIMAWRGSIYPGLEGVVQAGRVGASLTYFEILGPWHMADDVDRPGQSTPPVILVLVFGIFFTALFLARRNLRAGRSDTKGAGKLTVFFVLTTFATWTLTEFRLDTLSVGSLLDQMTGPLLAKGLAQGAMIGFFYIALEPYARRLWPESLVSWNRLLMGRFRDPLVGRDFLVGMAVIGLLTAGLATLRGLLFELTGTPIPLDETYLSDGLDGIRYGLAWLFIIVQRHIGQAMFFMVSLLIFRLVLRRDRIAFIGFIVVNAAVWSVMPTNLPVWAGIAQGVGVGLIVVAMIACLLRFGLVGVMGGTLINGAMGASTLTWDLQSWYVGSSLVTMVAVLALAGWAFYIALAGKSLFKDSVLD
ncbi:MAG: serine/threonine-protein kinase [Candidatus Krumholzibacteria bacterium]|nr:serine/threonine-protein kinase [Candidatus Krumholzibacteria bacterium]